MLLSTLAGYVTDDQAAVELPRGPSGGACDDADLQQWQSIVPLSAYFNIAAQFDV
jgi:hypothetical protein